MLVSVVRDQHARGQAHAQEAVVLRPVLDHARQLARARLVQGEQRAFVREHAQVHAQVVLLRPDHARGRDQLTRARLVRGEQQQRAVVRAHARVGERARMSGEQMDLSSAQSLHVK